MLMSGLVILAFIVYHLAHFTIRLPGINGVGDFTKLTTELHGQPVPDVYAMMILGFQVWWVAAFYLIAQALLFIHLGHGISSAFQSFGFRNHVWWPRIQFLAKAASTAIFVGYALIPLQFTCASSARITPTKFGRKSKPARPRNPSRLRPPERRRTNMATLNSNIPSGPLSQKWESYKFNTKLINPANKRKYKIIVVGAGLAGSSACATLAELGYEVHNFVFHDSPRRAHSVAAQGGINAAKNYQNDGDSVHRLFYDTIKGGDFRAREANVHRLAEVSVNIIDQCAAQGVPFAREYGGLLDNRSFGGAQVSRTFYARGQTGPTTVARRVFRVEQDDRRGGGEVLHAFRNARSRRRGRPRERHHRPQPSDRRNLQAQRGRGGAGDRRLRQRLQSLDLRPRLQLHRHLARLQTRRLHGQSLLHADPSDLHPGQRRLSIQTHVDERIAAQRRSRLGAEEEGRLQESVPRTLRRTIAIIISNACIRHSAISRPATLPAARPRRFATKVAASAKPAWACISTFSAAIGRLGEVRSASVTATCSRCITKSRTRTPTKRRCASIPPCITRWAASGWITT
jgi:hypothetical protein